MQRPLVAITLGDVAGVGPEVVARAIASPKLHLECRPLIVGSPAVLRRELAQQNATLEIVEVGTPRELARSGTLSESLPQIVCWNPSHTDVTEVPLGRIDARAGAAAYDWLVAATRAALAGEVDAVVTAPLNKAALHRAGRHYPGHTEILAEECRVDDFAMMLYLPPGEAIQGPYGLGVAHVTLHTSIRSVPDLLSTEAIREKIGLVHRFLKSIGCSTPRIGVCALNPHAGEDGLFGDEESRHIAPAVQRAMNEGIDVRGPLPADTLLQRAVSGESDGVVAMYHDQGHIALKLIGFHRAVNVTLGLPIIRTSPSHGTAFDIAGKNLARPEGLHEAIRIACKLAMAKQETFETSNKS